MSKDKMSKDKNFGLATPRVRILSELPKIVKAPQTFNFDISAFQWNAINNSPFLSPLLTENVINPEKTFAFCFPSKRKFFVNNQLKHSTGPVDLFPFDKTPEEATSPDRTIFWTPVGPPPPPPPPPSESEEISSDSARSSLGVINEILEEQKFPSYWESIPTTNPDSRKPLIDEMKPPTSAKSTDVYSGPKWINRTYKEQSQPDDRKIVERWFKFISKGFTHKELKGLEDKPEKENEIRSSVFQENVGDGLWWGLESSQFLDKENMPFWVTLEVPKDPPSPSEYETLYIISLGLSSTDNSDRYDLYLSRNRKPTLIDYYGIKGGGEGDAIVREFDVEDSSRLGFDSSKLDIGFLVAGGRLIIFVNGAELVYNRIIKTGTKDSIGTLKESKIAKGSIRVYGTNTTANIYAYPMTFAEKSAMAFPIASQKIVEVVDRPPVKTKIQYSAADGKGNPTKEPVVSLPVSADVVARTSIIYGVDCRKFYDANGDITLKDSFGLNRKGIAEFFSAASIPSIPKSPLPTTEFFLLLLTPESRKGSDQWLGADLPFSLPPYFFHLKGVDTAPTVVKKANSVDVTDLVLSIKESASAPDYFHIKKSASITLYNEGGALDELSKGLSKKLLRKSYGVEIDWSWNKNDKKTRTKTFTGIIVSQDSNQVPGKETLTLQCEDYHHILKNTPIINSPFYDGMVAYHVIRDLAKRAGIKEFSKEWDDEDEYFLPSGYSFSSPRMRFKSIDKLFDCIVGIAKRFEAFVYFDGAGVFHIGKLPGGLLGPPKSTVKPKVKFSSDPSTTDQLILDHRNITTDFGSTFNQLNVMTLDRDTRNLIMVSKRAKPRKDRLSFRKELLIDQPAYGEKEVAKAHALELVKRIFAPILKTSFKTIGNTSILAPLDFVTVDGIRFRIVSIARSFNADSNDYVNEYEAEWLNG
jgi:hypothetical protein